jgi:hypothetical protein
LALAIVACAPPADNEPFEEIAPVNESTSVDESEAEEAATPLTTNLSESEDIEVAEDVAEQDDNHTSSEDLLDENESAATSEASTASEAGADVASADDNEVASEAENAEDESSETVVEVPNEDGIFTTDNRNERQRIISADWATDWNRRTVPYSELLALLPVRDGIPAIDDPQFISPGEAGDWLADIEPVIAFEWDGDGLADIEPVIAFEWDGDARAYPLQIMTYHEIVNDVVGELPVTVTFCPLCNSAIVFDRNLDGAVYDFGTSGWLRNSDLVMYDRQTESLWQQFTGEGIVGELAGEQLTFLASSLVSFADFREAYPEGIVLSRETGHQRPYGQNPYPGYDAVGQNPFAFVGVPDGRLAAMERVITVSLDEVDVAYPLSVLFEAGTINDNQGGQDLAIFHVGGTASALDSPIIQLGADVGATGVFDPNLNGQKLTFIRQGGIITDEQTGSSWNIFGQATDGPLVGESLAQFVHGDHFWFAWAAFQPETVIYGS